MKSDNTSEIIKKMGYSKYYIRKINSIKNKDKKRKYLLNLFLNYSKYHNLKCDLKTTCINNIQIGGGKKANAIIKGYTEIIDDIKSNISLEAKLQKNKNISLKNEQQALKKKYEQKIKNLTTKIQKTNLNSLELQTLLNKNNQKLETSETLTTTKVNELKDYKGKVFNVNKDILQVALGNFYKIFLKINLIYTVINTIRDVVSNKGGDIYKLLQPTISNTQNDKSNLNYTLWFERLDIFNENLIPMNDLKKIIDDCYKELNDLYEDLGIKFNVEAMEVTKLQPIEINKAHSDVFAHITVIEKIKKLHKLTTDLKKYDLHFMYLVISNTLNTIECPCTSPCNYQWETWKTKQVPPWCSIKDATPRENHPCMDYPYQYGKYCLPIDKYNNRYKGKTSKTTGQPVIKKFYAEILKKQKDKNKTKTDSSILIDVVGEEEDVVGKDGKVVKVVKKGYTYVIGNTNIPYKGHLNKGFCLWKYNFPHISSSSKCIETEKLSIRQYFASRKEDNKNYWQKIERIIDKVFADSNL